MKENFLHFIWQYKLFDTAYLFTEEGDALQIIDVGKPNTDAGPDFLNAKIRIEDTLLVGNIEIHVHEKDWFSHKHQDDAAYNNVILHVVYNCSTKVFKTGNIPILVLNGRISPLVTQKNNYLNAGSVQLIPCEKLIDQIDKDSFKIHSFYERLFIERLEEKTARIAALIDQNDYERQFFILLSSYFGQNVNKTAFEEWAQRIDLKHTYRLSTNSVQIEAYVFGMAGFLQAHFKDDYFQQLKKEFNYLKKLFKLKPIEAVQWKFSRIRPEAFPSLRLAQMAAILKQTPKLVDGLIRNFSTDSFRKMMENIEVNDYWTQHSNFGKSCKPRSTQAGKQFADILIINAIIPFLFYYGKQNAKPELGEQALELMNGLAAEKNKITKIYSSLGLKALSALQSQAQLELHKSYCLKKKCLECQIGLNIFTTN